MAAAIADTHATATFTSYPVRNFTSLMAIRFEGSDMATVSEEPLRLMGRR